MAWPFWGPGIPLKAPGTVRNTSEGAHALKAQAPAARIAGWVCPRTTEQDICFRKEKFQPKAGAKTFAFGCLERAFPAHLLGSGHRESAFSTLKRVIIFLRHRASSSPRPCWNGPECFPGRPRTFRVQDLRQPRAELARHPGGLPRYGRTQKLNGALKSPIRSFIPAKGREFKGKARSSQILCTGDELQIVPSACGT